MPRLQLLGLLSALVAGLPPPAAPTPTADTGCPAVAPMPDFQPSLLDGEWVVPIRHFCLKVSYTRLAGNRVEVRQSNVDGLTTLEMNNPGILQGDDLGPGGSLTVLQGKAEEYLIIYVCTTAGPTRGEPAIISLVRPSANLQDVGDLVSSDCVKLLGL